MSMFQKGNTEDPESYRREQHDDYGANPSGVHFQALDGQERMGTARMDLKKDKLCLITLTASQDEMSVLWIKEEQYTFPCLDCTMTFNTASQSIFVAKPGQHGLHREITR